MSSYDPWQTTFYFSLLSNAVSGQFLTIKLGDRIDFPALLKEAAAEAQATLTTQLKQDFAGAILENNTANPPPLGANDWTTVWGPQVFVIPPEFHSINWLTHSVKCNATNAMAVVFSPSLQRYIVAIAATNFVSAYDWLIEDFNVKSVVAWEGALQAWAGNKNATSPSSKIPCISSATNTGITNLLAMTDTVITHQSLIDFLASVDSSGCTLTFTGHSLAGALSPTLAMAAFDPTAGLLKNSTWTVEQAQAYPTAGATPGNGPFAQLFNGAGFGGSNGTQPWQLWNTDLYNYLDIVPRAWNKELLTALPPIYKAYYDDLTVLDATIKVALADAALGELVAGPYTSINRAGLNGETSADAANEFAYQYTVTIDNNMSAATATELMTLPQAAQSTQSPTDKTDISWPSQLLFQHTKAYSELILGEGPTPSKSGNG
ncbi:hypothetical protein B0F88_104190 [Methylobacter tundripaludum]|uniref:Fungal lipase-like domain-containing protein n=1 Tax=Methylobacter tundripaludum TaxID=173365 RepID=A0A2S6H4T0_9GAMM|nr:hypothetical protein [Methylobacter tundripaludum]PPK72396.1 hypothetical protein B0F88_104190 [Methylobacter tundripaludum]